MRLLRMQLTIRRMMIAVAVLGVAFSIPVALRRRSEAFSRIGKAHFDAANTLIFEARRPASVIFRHIELEKVPGQPHTRPWLLVETDPPKPE